VKKTIPLILAPALLVLLSCAPPTEPAVPAAEPSALTPTERLLIMEDAQDRPMKLVLNSSPAGDVFLRTPCLPVHAKDAAVAHLASRMLATVTDEGGVGIAAPQVGINRRVIWVKRLDEPDKAFRAYLNARILELSGSLSIPAGFGKVLRSESVVVAYEDPEGRSATETVKGFTARIFQHEIDHLAGVLFIDRMDGGAPLMPKDEYRKMKEGGK
jgi:peptide deformylase